MKKIELHVHLDGSIRPSTVSNLLNIPLEEVKEKMIVKENNKDLEEYLTKFDLPIKIMQTKENLKTVAYELAEDLKNDGVIYAEVRFAPNFHIKEGLTLDEVVESVIDGVKNINGIKINIILCMMRGDSFNNNLKIIKLAEKYLNKGVVAIDLAGNEAKYKTRDYKKLFDIAKEKNIPFTIHAGEADGALSVMDATNFGAKRIGHGIKIIENDDIINNIIKNVITLEVCPTSNVDTKNVLSYEKHPIKKLFDKGVKVTINTDDRTVSNVTLSSEYKRLKASFDFTNKDFFNMNVNAINASFMTEKEKVKYINILKEDYNENIHGKAW